MENWEKGFEVWNMADGEDEKKKWERLEILGFIM